MCVHLSIYLSIYLMIYLSIHLSIYLSIHIHTYVYIFAARPSQVFSVLTQGFRVGGSALEEDGEAAPIAPDALARGRRVVSRHEVDECLLQNLVPQLPDLQNRKY